MIKLVIFDMDDTIVHNSIPFSYMRERILRELKIDNAPQHLYEFLRDIGAHALAVLEREELKRAKTSFVDKDLDFVLMSLKKRGIKVAILTRNTLKAAKVALGKRADEFDAIVGRDSGFRPKPAPDGVIYLMNRFGTKPWETLMVGDYDYDIEAGKRAGCITVRIGNGEADFNIKNLKEILRIVEQF